MNATTTNQPATDTKISTTEKKAFFATQILEKKTTMKSLSLRPSRSVKRNSSVKPLLAKRA